MSTIGQLILTEQHCDDSMAWARQVLPIAVDGTVLISRHLTQARGRHNRRWVLADGQITHTIILKPHDTTHTQDLNLATLNMALILGLAAPLQKYGVTLKWPNDLYLHDKKLGGMLIENIWHEETLVGIVFGYSININNTCIGHEILEPIATSLSDVTKEQYDLGLLHVELFKSLSHFYAQWKKSDHNEIFNTWRKAQGYLGKKVSVHNKDGSIVEGPAHDVLPNGDLICFVEASNQSVTISFNQIEEIRV